MEVPVSKNSHRECGRPESFPTGDLKDSLQEEWTRCSEADRLNVDHKQKPEDSKILSGTTSFNEMLSFLNKDIE